MSPLPPRHHAELRLSAEERKRLKAAAAADLRTTENFVTALVLAALAKKGASESKQRPPNVRSTPSTFASQPSSAESW